MRTLAWSVFFTAGCLTTAGGMGDDDSLVGDGADDDAVGGDADVDADSDSDPDPDPDPEPGPDVDPPLGGSSGGSGGGAARGVQTTGDGVEYRIVAYGAKDGPIGLLLVYSGTEGGEQMMMNLENLGPYYGLDGLVFAVLDGVDYWEDADAGASVLDDVRAHYDIDNDRTYLLGESAGTRAALSLGFHVRQSYFAAYWANDVNAADVPAQTADELGFAPWGNAGPGGHYDEANVIVDGMRDAGYRIEEPAPYDGPGADEHGASEQFHAALWWFQGKSR